MREKNPSSSTLRDRLKAAGALGLGEAASADGRFPAGGDEDYSLTCQQVLDSAPWSPRYGLGALVFQDRLWVLGGTGTAQNGTQFNDAWSSEDGLQ